MKSLTAAEYNEQQLRKLMEHCRCQHRHTLPKQDGRLRWCVHCHQILPATWWQQFVWKVGIRV